MTKQLAGQTEAQPAQLSKKVQSALDNFGKLTDRDFYSVGGKDVPGARALQHIANEEGGITTQILDSGLNAERAWAKVRGWFAKRPEFFKEDVCTIVFDLAFREAYWRQFVNGCSLHRQGCPVVMEDGKAIMKNNLPIFTDSNCFLRLVNAHERMKIFGDRICVTKAESRVHVKLLSGEWREDPELLAEKQEVEDVAGDSLQNQTSTQPAQTQPAQAAAAQPAAAKTEPKKEPAKTAEPKPAEAKTEPAPAAAAQPVQPEVVSGTEEKTPPAPAAATDAAVEKKPAPKRSERIRALAKEGSVSEALMVEFIPRSLGLTELKAAGRKQLDCFITSLEVYLFNHDKGMLGDLIRGKADAAASLELNEIYTKELAK